MQVEGEIKNFKLKFIFIFLISIEFLFAGFAYSPQQTEIPVLNQQISNYVEGVIGQKVGRGECWDLAYYALKSINATWDGKFKYGKPVDPLKEIIYSGDIIQFNGVKLKYKKENTVYTEVMQQHTAIIYKVLRKGVYQIAHQNNDFSGKTVGISELNINQVVKGKILFYRPVKK